jgi:hypothetical protein
MNIHRIPKQGNALNNTNSFMRWTIVSLLAVAGLFIFFYFVYIQANPPSNYWIGLWSFLESNTFRSLWPSLAVPLILFVFGVYERVQKQRHEDMKQAEERREKLKKEKEERREKRLHAIDKTKEMLNQINSLVSEVRFYDDTKGSDITMILAKIASQSSSLTEVLNIWNIFPLPKTVDSLILDYMRVLYWGAWAVAHCIYHSLVGDRKELQENLAMMQRGIVGTTFDPILNILKNSNELLELAEELSEGKGDGKDDQIITKIMNQIDKYVEECRKSPEGSMCKIINEELKDTEKGSKDPYSPRPRKPLKAIWATYERSIGDGIPQGISELIDQHITTDPIIKEKMKNETKSLIKNIFKLEVYRLLLEIDRFIIEEILPPRSSESEKDDAREFREAYRSIIEKFGDNLNTTIVSSKFGDFLNSAEYKMFEKSFFKIPPTDLINVIAIDTIKRIKKIGMLLRFAATIPLDETNRSTSQ